MQSHYAPLIAAVVTILLTTLLLLSKAAKKISDVPNERSLHSAPVPRIGGVALIVGMLSGWSIMFGSLTWWVLLPLIALFAVSIMDDMYNLSVRWRLLVHLGGSVGVCGDVRIDGAKLFAWNGSAVADGVDDQPL